MHLIVPKAVFLFCFLAACCLAILSDAEENRDYSVTCAKTDELKMVAAKMRSEFTSQMRRSSVYGPLLVRTVWLKSYARRINRRARFQFDCDWRQEIGNINQAICDIEALMSQAQLRAAYGLERPIDPYCLTCIYQLIGQSKSIVYCLCVDGGFIQPVYELGPTPSLPTPGYLPAPGYLPQPVVPGERVPTPAAEPAESDLIAPGPPLTLRRLPWQSPVRSAEPTPASPPPSDSALTLRRLPWQSPVRSAEPASVSPLPSDPPVYWNGPFRAARPAERFNLIGN